MLSLSHHSEVGGPDRSVGRFGTCDCFGANSGRAACYRLLVGINGRK